MYNGEWAPGKWWYGCDRQATWNLSFFQACGTLKQAARNLPRDIGFIRGITDTAIPTFVLPWAISIEKFTGCKNDLILHGELLLPEGVKTPQETPGIILYFHGGAFCVCNPATHRLLLSNIMAETGCAIYALDYRRPPEDPFPAALDDAVAAFLWLVQDRHFPADRIFMAGDSAGGGLALACACELRDQGLPQCAGLMLMSPWVDLAEGTHPMIPFRNSWERNGPIDFLPQDLAIIFAEAPVSPPFHPNLTPV